MKWGLTRGGVSEEYYKVRRAMGYWFPSTPLSPRPGIVSLSYPAHTKARIVFLRIPSRLGGRLGGSAWCGEPLGLGRV